MISAIGGGSSMDTAKGIGIIVDNPEFEDVVSLEGGGRCQEACGIHHCGSYHR